MAALIFQEKRSQFQVQVTKSFTANEKGNWHLVGNSFETSQPRPAFREEFWKLYSECFIEIWYQRRGNFGSTSIYLSAGECRNDQSGFYKIPWEGGAGIKDKDLFPHILSFGSLFLVNTQVILRDRSPHEAQWKRYSSISNNTYKNMIITSSIRNGWMEDSWRHLKEDSNIERDSIRPWELTCWSQDAQ